MNIKKAAGMVAGLFFLIAGPVFLRAQESDGTVKFPFPYLQFVNTEENAPAKSPFKGKIVGVEQDEKGASRIIIETKKVYYWEGVRKESVLQYLIGGLLSADGTERDIEEGDEIGIRGPAPYLTVRTREPDPYCVMMTEKIPKIYNGYWWFSPDWFIKDLTEYISFRQVDSLDAAIADFYGRSVSLSAGKEEKVTIGFSPELDRIRVLTVMNEYPGRADITEELKWVEEQFLEKSGIFTLQNTIPGPDGYTVVLYWQAGFNRYLKKEYVLGDRLWLYCSLVALDQEKKLIMVLVRDFFIRSLEDIYRERVAYFEKNQ